MFTARIKILADKQCLLIVLLIIKHCPTDKITQLLSMWEPLLLEQLTCLRRKTCLLSLWICVCLTLCDWNRLDNVVNILAFRVEKMNFVFSCGAKKIVKTLRLLKGQIEIH